MRILSWLFGISDQYFKLREDYERSKYPFFRFLLIVVTASLPSLIFWWASSIDITSGGVLFGVIMLFLIGFAALVKTPKELFILSLVALTHGFWILADRRSKKKQEKIEEKNEDKNKVENEAESEEENNEEYLENNNFKQRKKRVVKWANSDANPLWDFLMSVIGIVLAFASVVVPFVILFS